jgi:hypothetical protein
MSTWVGRSGYNYPEWRKADAQYVRKSVNRGLLYAGVRLRRYKR